MARGGLDAAAAAAMLDRLHATERLQDGGRAAVALEAVAEDQELKREMLAQLDELLPDAALLASNTSTLAITRIAAATRAPERVVGLHFFNPPTAMALVEVVPSLVTSPEVVELATAFVTGVLGKEAVRAPDRAGFIVNALLTPYLMSAIRMHDSGEASAEDIDRAMVLGCAHPMGPLALADLIGLDTLLAGAEAIHAETGEASMLPPAGLRRRVEAGLLGRKSGHGFHAYE